MAIACGAPNGRTGTGNWRQQRHNAIRDLIAKIARQAGLQIAVERDMLPGIHPGIRADVILYDFPRRGTHTAVDVMVKAIWEPRSEPFHTCSRSGAYGEGGRAGKDRALQEECGTTESHRGLASGTVHSYPSPAVFEQHG